MLKYSRAFGPFKYLIKQNCKIENNKILMDISFFNYKYSYEYSRVLDIFYMNIYDRHL